MKLRIFPGKPFKLLKKYLPKTLFGRALVIMIAPVLLIQLTVAYVFFDRHLSKEMELLADNMAGNIALITEMAFKTSAMQEELPLLKHYSSNYLNLTFNLKPAEGILTFSDTNYTWRERILVKALNHRVKYNYSLTMGDEMIQVEVATVKGNFVFSGPTKNLFTRTTPLLLWWALATPLLFLIISILFMRNQIRPLRKLAFVVSAFGKGRDVKNVRPAGAYEVRKAAQAFNSMKERIQRQIRQRTEMLAGVSHDLRTPLTHMELQLAMMKPSAEIKDLQSDVKAMTRMIDEYLAFAKGEDGEPLTLIDLNKLIRDIIKNHPKNKITFKSASHLPSLPGRWNGLLRCLTNLITNAVRYAPRVWIHIERQPKRLHVFIDDNGPGIPEDKRKDMFRPFVRMDASRNPETGGTGLGLAIAKDIAHSHGGRISLNDSPQGGLRVILSLPL